MICALHIVQPCVYEMLWKHIQKYHAEEMANIGGEQREVEKNTIWFTVRC